MLALWKVYGLLLDTGASLRGAWYHELFLCVGFVVVVSIRILRWVSVVWFIHGFRAQGMTNLLEDVCGGRVSSAHNGVCNVLQYLERVWATLGHRCVF